MGKVNASRQAIEMVVCMQRYDVVNLFAIQTKPIGLCPQFWHTNLISKSTYIFMSYKAKKISFHTYVFLLDLSPCVPCGARMGFFHFQSNFYLLLYSLGYTKRNRISVNGIFLRLSNLDVLILMQWKYSTENEILVLISCDHNL